MTRAAGLCAVCALIGNGAPSAAGQQAAPIGVHAVSAPVAAAGVPANTLPLKTVVDIEITDALNSKTSRIGDGFAIRLAEPVMIEGRIVVPAGVPGRGEVIHAAKAGFGGKAGELILAARYLECGSTRIPLGHFHFGASGKAKLGEAFAVGMVVPFGGLLVSGGQMSVEAGAHANAQVTADVVLPGGFAATCVRSNG